MFGKIPVAGLWGGFRGIAGLFRRLGLQVRLLLAFMLVALMPVTVLLVAQQRALEASTLERAGGILEQVADVQQRRLNFELAQLTEYLQLVASRTQMRLSLATYNQSRSPESLKLVQRILDDALAPIEVFCGIWIRDQRGDAATSAIRDRAIVRGVEVPAMPHEASAPVELRWQRDGPPELWLSTRLELDTEFIGSLHILACTDEMQRTLLDFPHSETGGKTLLLVHGPGQERYVINGLAEPPRPLRGLSEFPWATGLEKAQRDGSSAFFAESVRVGDELLVARSLDYGFGDMLMQVSVDGAREMARFRFPWLLFDLFVIVVLSVAMALALSRMISRPIESLDMATQRLRAGDTDVRVPEVAWGEFAGLTRTFNEAAADLGNRTRVLEDEILERRRAQRKLASLANTDPLTGLVNRRHFMNRLAQKLSQPCAAPTCGALLYLDLDDFKPVNDRYGHETGDEVLRVVADRLRGLVRDVDLAARIGGDEFVIMLSDRPNGLDPKAVAQRVAAKLSLPMSVRDLRIQVGCSVGVVDLVPGQVPQQVLHEADSAMYRVKAAKRSGSGSGVQSDAGGE